MPTGGSFEPSASPVPNGENEKANWVFVIRGATVHSGPSVCSYGSLLFRRYRIAADRLSAGLVPSLRPRHIATWMDLREVLSRGAPRSWSAARSARLAKHHTSGARCTKAESCKPGQETRTASKDREITTSTGQKNSAQPRRVRQLDREGVSRVLRKLAA